MLNRLRKYGLFLILVVLTTGCTKKNNTPRNVIAEVGSEKLYLSDVESVVPKNSHPEDSAIMTEDYIKKWIKRELLLQKAEENLTAQEKDVAKSLEDYRKSLIIYKYKNALISQRMDTTVTDEQIEGYYNDHPEKFILNKNIVKAIFIKVPEELSDPEQLKTMSGNTTTEGIIELRDYCLQYAKMFDIFTDRWVDFQLVAENIPQPVNDPEQFLRKNQMIELSDSVYYYLVTILDYKLKKEQAPLDFVKENIKNLILNRRKIDFLKEVEKNVYSEGVRKRKFKMFKKESHEAEE